MESKINPDLPKYIQIYQWLHGKIRTKKIRVGDMLPTEMELASLFEVSRMTARKALNKLLVEGIVDREQGRGTFLTAETPKDFLYNMEVVTGFFSDMKCYGITPSLELLHVEVTLAGEKLSQLLHIKSSHKVISIGYLFRGNKEPVMIEQCYLPYSEFHALLELDLNQLRYPLLKEHYNVIPTQAEQNFRALLCTDREKTLFQIPSPIPCMQLECVMFDSSGRPFEVGTYLYRGDRYQFNIHSMEYVYTKK